MKKKMSAKDSGYVFLSYIGIPPGKFSKPTVFIGLDADLLDERLRQWKLKQHPEAEIREVIIEVVG